MLRLRSVVFNCDCTTHVHANREFLLLRKIFESNRLQVPHGVQLHLRHDSRFLPFRNAAEAPDEKRYRSDGDLVIIQQTAAQRS